MQTQQELQQLSWKIHYLKMALGLEEVRNEVLRKMLKRSVLAEGVIFGKTFGADTYRDAASYCSNDIVQLLDDVNRTERYLLFTATNTPARYTRETHYQGYVVDFQKKVIHVFDPAKRKAGQGEATYQGFVTELTIIPILQTKFRFIYEIPAETPQMTETDTFCQSWSLWMMIQFLNKNFQQSMRYKYKKLYNFYRQLLHDFPTICHELERMAKTGRNCTLPPISTENQAVLYLLENFD